jgi:uncharacterized repeat protein (TIGR01451 family)
VLPTIPPGWVGTDPADFTRLVTVGVTDLINVNFGLLARTRISGQVFLDTGAGGGVANDGIRNGSEGGLGGVTLRWTDSSGGITYATTTTNGAGEYVLAIPTEIPAGTEVRIVKSGSLTHIATGASVGNTAGIYDRVADAVIFVFETGVAFTGVNFGVVPEMQLLTDGAQTGAPGSTLFYSHTFIAGSGGEVTFSLNETPSPPVPGWNSVLYWDVNDNGVIDPSDPVLAGPITGIVAGQQISLIVKNFIPAAAPLNAQDQIQVTAHFNHTHATPPLVSTQTRTNLTTVGEVSAAGLKLVKSVDKAAAFPGELIVYTITYTNHGIDPVQTLTIADRVPAFTTFISQANGALPAALSSVASSIGVPAAGDVRWTFEGTLAPGQSGTVSFTVQVNQ